MEYVYVLMEEGWEYNDETFFHPESGSGSPRKIFASYEAAHKECDKRNIDSLKSLFEGEASQYFYNLEDVIPYESRNNYGPVEDLTQKIFGLSIKEVDHRLDKREDFEIKPDVTDADWFEFYSKLSLSFWNVVECEKE